MAALITTHSYKKSGVQGNCGGSFISRLGANYTTTEEAAAKYKQLLAEKQLRPIRTTDNMGVHHLLAAIREAEGVPAGGAFARAYPMEWAFADVLESATINTPALVGMTDTNNGEGDGHPGAYATRHFAHWWGDQGLAEDIHMTTGLRYESRKVFGWWIYPNYKAVNKYLAAVKEQIYREIEKWNSEGSFAEQRKADEDAAAALAAALDRGWREYSATPAPRRASTRQRQSRVEPARPADTTEAARAAVAEAHARILDRDLRRAQQAFDAAAVPPEALRGRRIDMQIWDELARTTPGQVWRRHATTIQDEGGNADGDEVEHIEDFE